MYDLLFKATLTLCTIKAQLLLSHALRPTISFRSASFVINGELLKTVHQLQTTDIDNRSNYEYNSRTYCIKVR